MSMYTGTSGADSGELVSRYILGGGSAHGSSRIPPSKEMWNRFRSVEYGRSVVTGTGMSWRRANSIREVRESRSHSRHGAITDSSGARAAYVSSNRTWSLPLPVAPWLTASPPSARATSTWALAIRGRAIEVPIRYEPSYTALARSIGKTKSRTNSSRRSAMCTEVAPVRSAFSRIGISSSPWPRSAQNATTSHRYVSISHRRITEVSRPPEYASTTFFTVFVTRSSSLVGETAGVGRRRTGAGRSGGPPRSIAAEQADDDALLGVEPVLRLVEDQAPRPVEHGVGDLLAAMGGEAVHDEGRRRGQAEQPLVELIPLKRLEPLLAVGLLPHADPRVRVDHVRALDGLARVGGQPHAAAELPARRQDRLAGLEPGRRGHHRRRAEQGGDEQHGMAHVVAVADPGE